MQRHLFVIIMAGSLTLSAGPADAQETLNARVTTAFDTDCETLLLKELETARSEVLIAIYSLTRRSLARAIVARRAAGVKVKVKMDVRQAESEFSKPAVDILRQGGVDIELISMPPYRSMHNKFVVIDGLKVLTGSYNFTSAATEDNWENMVKIEHATVARRYREQWKKISSRKKK